MDLFHHKKEKRLQYVEWFVSDEESDDNWMGHLNKTTSDTPGGALPFPDSEWTYSNHDSPFDSEEHPDTHIYQIVHEALYANPQIDTSNIKITVLNANVTLTGTVRTKEQILLTENTIRKIKEVWAINNSLRVEEDRQGNFRSPDVVIS